MTGEEVKSFFLLKIIQFFPRHHCSAAEGHPTPRRCADTARARQTAAVQRGSSEDSAVLRLRLQSANSDDVTVCASGKRAKENWVRLSAVHYCRGRTSDSEIITVLRENPLQQPEHNSEGQRELPRRQTHQFRHDNGSSSQLPKKNRSVLLQREKRYSLVPCDSLMGIC